MIASFLFASLFWGSVGFGYFLYGKKQTSFVPMLGGLALIGISYFASTALMMSLISLGTIAVIHVLIAKGY